MYPTLEVRTAAIVEAHQDRAEHRRAARAAVVDPGLDTRRHRLAKLRQESLARKPATQSS